MLLQVKNKRLFDENNAQDVELYKNFLINNTWGKEGCPFLLEQPFLSIPDMIKERLVFKFLGLRYEFSGKSSKTIRG